MNAHLWTIIAKHQPDLGIWIVSDDPAKVYSFILEQGFEVTYGPELLENFSIMDKKVADEVDYWIVPQGVIS